MMHSSAKLRRVLGPGRREARSWSQRDVLTSVDSSGRAILFHIPSGTYLGLDQSAARIVELLNVDPDPVVAGRALCGHYGIPLDTAISDVMAVITAVNEMKAVRHSRSRRPTFDGALKVLQSWRIQGWRNRAAIVQCAGIAVVVEVGLKLVDVSRLARWLKVPLTASETSTRATTEPANSVALTLQEQRLCWALDWVMRRWIYDGTCLRRSLALGWILRRRSPELRLGMLREAESTAHAWVEVQGVSLDSVPGVRPFAYRNAAPPTTSGI